MAPSTSGAEAGLRVSGGTLGAQLAQSLERDIRVHGWQVGHPIGSEAELTARYGVGVAALREAARILAERGVARSRRGPGGGLFVTAPDREIVTDAARRFLDHSGVSGPDIFEALLGLELVAVRRLAESIDAAAASSLRDLLDAETKHAGRSWSELPNVHLEIARLAGNPVLELFIKVLIDLAISHYGPRINPRTAAAWVHARDTELIEAIISGDAALAQMYLRRFVDSVVRSVNPPDAIP